MRVVALATMALLVLAGCTSDEGGESKPAPKADSGAGGPTEFGAAEEEATVDNQGGGKGTGANRRPLLSFSADVSKGDGPLEVTFTIAALDDDDDPMTWTLDADGEGTEDASGTVASGAEAEHVYTFRVKGTYTALARLHDGTDEVEASVTITVLSSEPVQTETASLLLQVEGCFIPTAYDTTGVVPGGTGSAGGGLSRLEFAVHEETPGRPFTAAWTFDTGFLQMSYFFLDADGTVAASDVDDTQNFGNYQYDGTVPVNAAYGVFFACGGPAQAEVVYQA